MSAITFYEKPGCATNARQKQMLAAAGHQVHSRSLLSEAWTATRLQEFFAGTPVEAWFNRAAPRIKSGEIDPTQLDAAQALALMLADPLLIKRPLIESGDIRFAGFDPTRVADLVNVPEGRDMEACSHRGEHEPHCPTPAPTMEPSSR